MMRVVGQHQLSLQQFNARLASMHLLLEALVVFGVLNQVGLELVLNHVGMPSSRDRIVKSVLASSTIPHDFFDDENNDPSKSSEDDEMMREIYYEYLSITPTTEFQVKKGEMKQVSLLKHWNNVKRSIDLCMADLYYHKKRVETWYYLGT